MTTETRQTVKDAIDAAYNELWQTYGNSKRVQPVYIKLEEAIRALRPEPIPDLDRVREQTMHEHMREQTTEAMWYDVHVTDHGIDGWDARTSFVRTYPTYDGARQWIAEQGYTEQRYGNSFYRPNEHAMGMKSYTIRTREVK